MDKNSSTSYSDNSHNNSADLHSQQISTDEYSQVLDAALHEFSSKGYDHTSLDKIAQLAGVSKRILNSYGTKTELYKSTILHAFNQLWPQEYAESINPHSKDFVPVEAMRRFIRNTYQNYQKHPDAVKLLVLENFDHHSGNLLSSKIWKSSSIALALDRILLQGHALGSFRPGISTEDVYIALSSIASVATTQGDFFRRLFGVNFSDPKNIQGMQDFIEDSVLGFLTTQLDTHQGNSYTHASPSLTTPPSTSESLYTQDQKHSAHHASSSDLETDYDTDHDVFSPENSALYE